MLVAAQNPCPFGYHNGPVKECTCSHAVVSRCQKCISGPLLDRADLGSDNIYIDVSRVEYEKLSDERLGKASADVQARMEAALLAPGHELPGIRVIRPDRVLGRVVLRHEQPQEFASPHACQPQQGCCLLQSVL